MAYFPSAGQAFADAFTQTPSIRRNRQAEREAAEAEAAKQFRARVDEHRDQTLEIYRAQVADARKAAEAGATPDQIATLREGAIKTLALHGNALDTIRASGIQAGLRADQISSVPAGEDFLEQHLTEFDFATQAGAMFKQDPAQAGAQDAARQLAEARRLAQELDVPLERVATAMGLLPSDSQGVRDQKIADAMAQGLSRSQAVDLVDGNLRVTSAPDQYGNVTLTNLRTGKAFQLEARRAATLGGDTAPGQTAPGQTGQRRVPTPVPGLAASVASEAQARILNQESVLEQFADVRSALAEGATGPLSNVQAAITKAASIFGAAVFVDNEVNRNVVRTFKNELGRALANNPRFNEGEQQRILGLAPDPANFFVSPRNELAKLAEIERTIRNKMEIDRGALEGRAPDLLPPLQHGTEANPLILPDELTIEDADKVEAFILSQRHLTGVDEVIVEDAFGRKYRVKISADTD